MGEPIRLCHETIYQAITVLPIVKTKISPN